MTKKILIAILMFSMIDTFAQSFDVVKKVKIYGVSWNMRFVRPIPIKNLKHFSHYNLTLNNDCFPGLEDLFDNYKSCDKYLTAQDTFRSEPRGCVACVKIYFKVKSITLYFRENACYYYKGQWYKPNYDLYYSIFWFFEKDAIMPNELIEEGKKSYEEKYNR
ncbi:MAG: hypothetical protein K6F29_08445 [Bacteroidales bacterium]|nr:hypothetical protein [Bacteroidales bacterium]